MLWGNFFLKTLNDHMTQISKKYTKQKDKGEAHDLILKFKLNEKH